METGAIQDVRRGAFALGKGDLGMNLAVSYTAKRTKELLMPKPTLYVLGCPNCGASLNVKPAQKEFACSYCAANVRFQEEGGVVELVQKDVNAIRNSSAKVAAELAMVRLANDIPAAESMANEKRDEVGGLNRILKLAEQPTPIHPDALKSKQVLATVVVVPVAMFLSAQMFPDDVRGLFALLIGVLVGILYWGWGLQRRKRAEALYFTHQINLENAKGAVDKLEVATLESQRSDARLFALKAQMREARLTLYGEEDA